MATEIVRRKSCDRCKDLIEEQDAQAALDAEEKGKPLLVLETAGELARTPIKYDDLCSKCVNRINNLLGQIALEKPASAKDSEEDDKKPDSGDDNPSTEEEAPAPTGKGRKGRGRSETAPQSPT